MKRCFLHLLTAIVIVTATIGMSGCAVYPVAPAYAYNGYYGAPAYYGPAYGSVVIGGGGYGGGWGHRGWR